MDSEFKYGDARRKLVFELREKGIRDWKVLRAIGTVPRHLFVATALAKKAYRDEPLPIGEGQTISQPYTVAYQTQLLHLQPGRRVLEIGTGSGYQAAILAELGLKVFTVERHEALYRQAHALLPRLGYHPDFFCGDGSKGLPDLAPFDNILVTAGAPYIPEALIGQLTIGGRMIIPVGNTESQKMVKIVRKSPDQHQVIEYDHFRFVPLLGEQGW